MSQIIIIRTPANCNNTTNQQIYLRDMQKNYDVKKKCKQNWMTKPPKNG